MALRAKIAAGRCRNATSRKRRLGRPAGENRIDPIAHGRQQRPLGDRAAFAAARTGGPGDDREHGFAVRGEERTARIARTGHPRRLASGRRPTAGSCEAGARTLSEARAQRRRRSWARPRARCRSRRRSPPRPPAALRPRRDTAGRNGTGSGVAVSIKPRSIETTRRAIASARYSGWTATASTGDEDRPPAASR